jgi:hypothetical protein
MEKSPSALLIENGAEGDCLIYASSDWGPFTRREGTQNTPQQDALHLQTPENFLTTFLILISFTSFQNPTCVALKKVRLQ